MKVFPNLSLKMRFTIFAILAALMSKACLNSSAKSIPDDGSDNNRFTALIPDVQYGIMDFLPTEDIVNVMQAFPSVSSVGQSLFLKRNKNYEVYIWDAEKCPRMDYTRSNMNPLRITFRSYDVILNILKLFGSVIQRLHVDNRIIHSTEKALNIGRYINAYTADSLVQLNLGAIKPATFAQFTVEFKKVEELIFATGSNKIVIKGGSIALNKQFPELRRLRMELWANIDYSFIDVKFPKLEKLYLVVGKNAWNRRDQIESMIKKNAHIRDFGIEHGRDNYVKYIQKILPNIENLTISHLELEDIVQFDHVKHFSYKIPQDDYEPDSLKNLLFPRLEKLRIENTHGCEPNVTDAWHGFFNKHLNIKSLHYIDRKLTCDDLMNLYTDLPNLTELTLECSFETNHEIFIRFIENHDKLMKFHLVHAFDNSETRNLQKRLENHWHSEYFNDESKAYTFERKPSDE